MSNAPANTNLIAHEKAFAAAGDAISLVLRVPAPLKSIADQVIRSASSVPANLAEGHGRVRTRPHALLENCLRIGQEVDSHLRLLARAGVIEADRAARTLEAFDEVRAMSWRSSDRRTDWLPPHGSCSITVAGDRSQCPCQPSLFRSLVLLTAPLAMDGSGELLGRPRPRSLKRGPRR